MQKKKQIITPLVLPFPKNLKKIKLPIFENNSLINMNNNKDLSLLNDNTKILENSNINEGINNQEIITIKNINDIRKDALGNEIKKGNYKNVKVTFADDNYNKKKLLDIVVIESYKKYYNLNDGLNNKSKNKVICCHCNIF